MIHPNILKRQADQDRLTAIAVERDYVLTHVLTAISDRNERAQIVFKGGTALRLCHFESYRYSADLDFSVIGALGVGGARQLIVEALWTSPVCVDTVIYPRFSRVGVLESGGLLGGASRESSS